MEWDVIIGLEVHAKLTTKSKIFSGASTAYGTLPNTQACAVDLALPGTLPVLNQAAVDMAIQFGLAIGAKIAPLSIFARKNYFYPDLPKGYQISQFEHPIVGEGALYIHLPEGKTKKIGITRAHLEEDAGKSYHENFQGQSGIDFNRAGNTLLEIVSAPDMTSALEAVTYLKTLHALLLYLEICDGNMQEGSFRCDVNVSLKPRHSNTLGTRTETKNVNSFKFVEKAILYEIQRQKQILENGGRILQETKLYDPVMNETRTLRTKEEANDYRYFPEPDLLPLAITETQIEKIKASLPELPDQKYARFKSVYQLSDYDTHQLVSSKVLAHYFEKTCSLTQTTPKIVANWIMGELMAGLNKANKDITESPIDEKNLALLLDRITDNTISGKIAKAVLEDMLAGVGSADEIISQKGLKQLTNTDDIIEVVKTVLAEFPEQLQAYKNGQERLFGFFVGQVMKRTQGKANPEQVNRLLKEYL